MSSWVDFWNRDTSIYVSERHKALHYSGVARDIAARPFVAPPDLPAQTGATEGCIAALTVLNDRMLRVLNIRAVLPLPEQDAA